ncbi:RAD52 family DNA repair protein [Brevundimonas sp.]|uniref:RAD52 family DNA repair protein n=1 Tax=Brevundimonas sp. TaxID=1871086 RepID=UPI0028AD3506|nr:RAD52 family DNA repair protein [Brevundimonas sp.]
MSFTPEQNAALSAPLDRSVVAEREQGGKRLSYIEAWHAIAEANRVFGFDGWNRETVELRQLGAPREVNGKMRVGYSAKVRITVLTPTGSLIVREGCGFGSGIDRDEDQAHESALKEAESDAMKRALMTFGNPFGLALYDKTQANVVVVEPAAVTAAKAAIDLCRSEDELTQWSADNKAALDSMGNDDRAAVRKAYAARLAQVRTNTPFDQQKEAA